MVLAYAGFCTFLCFFSFFFWSLAFFLFDFMEGKANSYKPIPSVNYEFCCLEQQINQQNLNQFQCLSICVSVYVSMNNTWCFIKILVQDALFCYERK